MKHKKFNEIFAYTYYMKNLKTGQKYHGVRWGNIKKGLPPIEDLGKIYFSSGKLSDSFKKNILDFKFNIKWTFDSIEEARAHEDKVNTKLMHKKDWEVWNNSKAIYNVVSPSLGRKVKGTEIAQKIGNANRGKLRDEKFKTHQSKTQKQKIQNNDHYFCTKEHSIKTFQRMKLNNPSKNGLSDEHKRKIGESQKGTKKGIMSENHRKNLSKALKGNIPWNKGKTGLQKYSEETRKKMSESRIGKQHTTETRKKMSENARGTKHLIGKKISCLCCKKEWDLGNFSKHIKKVSYEF